MFFSSTYNTWSLNQRKQSLLLVVVLLSLVYSSFSGMSMMSAHVDTGSDLNHTQHDMHALDSSKMVEMASSHCGDSTDNICNQHDADMDCSASHCNPVGTLPLDAFALTALGQMPYPESKPQSHFIASAPPYIPPIVSHV